MIFFWQESVARWGKKKICIICFRPSHETITMGRLSFIWGLVWFGLVGEHSTILKYRTSTTHQSPFFPHEKSCCCCAIPVHRTSVWLSYKKPQLDGCPPPPSQTPTPKNDTNYCDIPTDKCGQAFQLSLSLELSVSFIHKSKKVPKNTHLMPLLLFIFLGAFLVCKHQFLFFIGAQLSRVPVCTRGEIFTSRSFFQNSRSEVAFCYANT